MDVWRLLAEQVDNPDEQGLTQTLARYLLMTNSVCVWGDNNRMRELEGIVSLTTRLCRIRHSLWRKKGWVQGLLLG